MRTGISSELSAWRRRPVDLADRIGFTHFQAWATGVRGNVRASLGQLDDALADFAVSIAVNGRFPLSHQPAPVIGTGDVHRHRGEPAQARVFYERALAFAESGGSERAVASAASGLALVLIDLDLDRAVEVADRARQAAFGEQAIAADIARARVAAKAGDDKLATELAAQALDRATARGEPIPLAQALELKASIASRADAAASRREALSIWERIGNILGAERVRLALARAEGDEQAAAAAEQELRRLGVALPVEGRPLAIATLGRFAVLRDDVAVAPAEWQSRKARELLKLLVARRGRSTPRDFLVEALWPGDDPAKTSNRLSVALNVLRTVLDHGRGAEVDHYVRADRDGIRLDLSTVSVDVEEFFDRADRGLRLHREGDETAASPLLEAAEAAYHGEFLEEDRYEEWAIPLRDEVRSTYLEVARALALAGPATTRYHLRILALDPYDEDTHLDLVSRLAGSGRHGEARRAYRRYVQKMGEIGVEPAGFPDLHTGQPA